MTTAREVMDSINQQFGAGTMRPASHDYYEVKMLPTGLAPFDDVLDGGVPLGRHIMIHGDFSTLKSYFALCAIASAQKNGLLCALIDSERTFDNKWAKALGVVTDDLIMPEVDKISTGEKAIDMVESLIHARVNLIVVDSVAALLPQAEQQKSMEEAKQLGRQAEMMSKAMRKLTARMRNDQSVIWVNQTRINPNIMFGSQESVPAGKALQFYSSYILGVYKAGSAKEDIPVYIPDADGKPVKKNVKKTVGMQFRIELKKSKLSSPNRTEVFTYLPDDGAIDDWSYLANKALGLGLLGYERGRWWTPEDNKKLPVKDFRGHLPLEELKKLLHGTVAGVDSAGVAPRARKPVGSQKNQSSSATGQGSTQIQEQEKSSSTGVTKTPSSRSRTQTRASGSTSRTSKPSVPKPRARASKESSSSSSPTK